MKSRKNLKIHSLILLTLLSSAILFTNHSTAEDTKTTSIYTTYTVQENDTLWDIALKHNYQNKNIKSFVKEIQEANDVKVLIRPGEVIKIPLSEIDDLISFNQIAKN